VAGRLLRQFGDGRDDPVYPGALSPDGRTLAGRVRPTGNLCLWDVTTGTLLRRLETSQARTDGPLAFSPDSQTVALADRRTRALRLWEVATGQLRWGVQPSESDPKCGLSAFICSADGPALVWASTQGGLHFVDAATGKEHRRWYGEQQRPSRPRPARQMAACSRPTAPRQARPGASSACGTYPRAKWCGSRKAKSGATPTPSSLRTARF
jgi:WD40 repeat protein